MELRQLGETDEAAFLEGLRAWDGENLSWYTFVYKPGMSFAGMLAILAREHSGVGLAEGRVPASMLYAFVDGRIVGRLSVRHRLNEQLRHRGGHIGYSVAPAFRGKGYASEIVRLGIPFCRSLGIQDILVTCADGNVPSWKIVEKQGGVLENTVWDEVEQESIRRYWIRS